MKRSILIFLSLLRTIPLHATFAADPVTIEQIPGSLFVKRIIENYKNGQYDYFLNELNDLYLAKGEPFAIETSDSEIAFWEEITYRNDQNKKYLFSELKNFANAHPNSSLGVMINEFLNFNLSDQEKGDLGFVTNSLKALTTEICPNSYIYKDIWLEMKQIANKYKNKHALLNAEYIIDDSKIHELKTCHIVLDLAMAEEFLLLLDSDNQLFQKISRSYDVYKKYLAYEYNTYYISMLLNGEWAASSTDELYVKHLMEKFIEEEKKITNDQIGWMIKHSEFTLSQL